MRTDKTNARHIDRRRLLSGAGLAAGAAASAAAAHAGEKVADAEVPKPQQSAGYRETEHVKTYYRLARL